MKNEIFNYINKGFSVLPLTEKSKKPVINWKIFQSYKVTTDEWIHIEKKFPNCNVGIVCGKISNLISFDFDNITLNEFYLKYPSVCINNPIMITPRGFRLFYSYELNLEYSKTIHLSGSLINKEISLSILSEGSYTVVPPSIHPEGKKYYWYNNICYYSLNKIEPDIKQLLESLSEKNKINIISESNNLFTIGVRNNKLFQIASNFVKVKMPFENIKTNLLYINNNCCSPPLKDHEVLNICESVKKYYS